MIQLSPTTALMLYLCLTLLFLLGFWTFNHYRLRNKRFFPLEKRLHLCEFCHYSYLGEEGKKISRCPRCGSYNKMDNGR